jgi:hypothetical protein
LIKRIQLCLVVATLFSGVLLPADLLAFNITVVDDKTGNPIPVGFRWLLEEDNTFAVVPNTFSSTSLSVSIPKSYAPVVDFGRSVSATAIIGVPATTRYIVSVLPDSDYTLSAANVALGQSAVTVKVHKYPVPTAQISVFVFQDDRAVSGILDIPAEKGLPEFDIQIYDYLGFDPFDVFNNPMGTTYQCCDGDGNYLLDGNGDPIVLAVGNGVKTDATGFALVKNIPPGIYTVGATPRDGQPWIQTTAIGGTPKLAAVVKAGEPPFFTQAGLLDKHVYLGFILPFNILNATIPLPPGAAYGTITGRIVNLHEPRPPSAALPSGPPVPNCVVGLNTVETGQELGLLAQPCNPDSTFTINNVPPGTYQQVAWDVALDNLLDVRVVTLASGATVNLGDVAIGRWFGTLEGSVFYDTNQNGFRNTNEVGIPDQILNVRFRDGSIFQSTFTDADGNYIFPEFVPFGKWTIAEVDFGEFKSTGATIVVDNGGVIPANNGWVMPSEGKRNPQLQAVVNPNTGNNRSRTETGRVLTEGIVVDIAQNNRIDWGKASYLPGETGGISGMVFYDTTRAEDDPRYQAGETWEPAIPGVRVNLYNAIQDGSGNWIPSGPAIQTTTTASSDATLPTGCRGPVQVVNSLISVPPHPGTVAIMDCAETIQNWNQVRPWVYDGRYAFGATTPVPPGRYIVEVIPPHPAYIVTKEEDKNIDFGEQLIPHLLPYECVGDPVAAGFSDTVPAELSLFPDQHIPTTSQRVGLPRKLCNRKLVILSSGQNAATDFSLYTEVPKAGRIVGEVQDPVANTFNQFDPNYGGAKGVPWVPVSIKDFAGNEVARVLTDEWGDFNAMVPSSFRANVLSPSGFSPNVVTVCSNSPASDPHYDPNFGEICLPVEAFPGKTAFLITTVNAIRGFVGTATSGLPPNLDCEFPDKTPQITSVIGPSGGPYVPGTGNQIHITSLGPSQGPSVTVPNPDYPDVPLSTPTIIRDYGFGSITGSVTVGGTPLTIDTWSPTDIYATVTGGTTGELIVTRGDNNRSTIVGITLNVGPPSPLHVPSGPYPTIQSAIDAASTGDLILVAPGTYNENIIMSKNVMLQGSGAGSTIINASTFDAAKLAAWTTKINDLVTGNLFTLVPGQRADFHLEQGAGITVLALDGGFLSSPRARIDGFTITGASGANSGGGIFVSGYAHYLEIGNNIIKANQGGLSGGIRIGWPHILNDPLSPTAFIGSSNDHISVHHNHFSKNGSTDHGAGLSIFNGSDNYSVTDNYICGNYSAGNGGGIAHYGLSKDGLIAKNKFYFNEGFGEGGAIMATGQLIPPGFPFNLTPGCGTVTVNDNLIQGNLGSDDAGGIGLVSCTGQDVANNPVTPTNWYHFNIMNNIIVNNLSGFSGAAMNIADTVMVNIIHNTIAHNDTTGTSGVFVNAGLTKTTPQTAGIMLKANSPALALLVGEFTQPVLYNNIFWQNRSFYFDSTINGGLGGILPRTISPYWDLQVAGTAATQNMRPKYSILSYTTDPFTGFNYNGPLNPPINSNIAADPLFVNPYFNVIKVAPGANALLTFPIISPLTPSGDYHIVGGSPAMNTGAPLTTPQLAGIPELVQDYDGEARPNSSLPTNPPDRGADEHYAAPGAIWSISGAVTSPATPGVQMLLVTSTGAPAGIAITGPGGLYSIPELANGTYTLTPSKPGLVFTPTSRIIVINNANKTGQNFKRKFH